MKRAVPASLSDEVCVAIFYHRDEIGNMESFCKLDDFADKFKDQ